MKHYQFNEAQQRMLRAIVTAYHDALRRNAVGEVERQIKLDVSKELKEMIDSGGMDAPRIVIDLQDGRVSGVTSNTGIRVLVADGDTRGTDDAMLSHAPHRQAPVVLQEVTADVKPDLCAALFEQARPQSAHEALLPLAPHQ